MNKTLLALLLILTMLITSCATSGKKALDPTLLTSIINKGKTTKLEVTKRFGEPTQTLTVDEFLFLGYRKVDTTMSAWSLVPIIGLVAGGVNQQTTTCVVKVNKSNDIVTDVNCMYSENFQNNLETLSGQAKTDKELLNIFNNVLSNKKV